MWLVCRWSDAWPASWLSKLKGWRMRGNTVREGRKYTDIGILMGLRGLLGRKEFTFCGWVVRVVTLIHMPQTTAVSWFEPCFRFASYWWILDEFSSRVYPTASHVLVRWSKFKPVTHGEAPSYKDTAFLAAFGAIHVKYISYISDIRCKL